MFQFRNKIWKEIFAITYEVLLKCDAFTLSLAPFTTRVCGPTWFKKDLPTTPDKDEAEINAIWKAYLTPTLLSSRITAGGPYRLYGYQKNHVARGLIQPKPTKTTDRACLRARLRHIHEWVFAFEPVSFAASFACTKALFRWWQDHYKRQADQSNPDTLQFLNWYLLLMLCRINRRKAKVRIFEIFQAFQKYFYTVNDPLHLKRTINYAAKTIRDKTLDKIPTMKFLPFIPNMYLFALHFKMKFPPLPTSKLALAFRPPYPKL